MRTVEGVPSERAAGAIRRLAAAVARRDAATTAAGWLALAYWRAALWALTLLVSLLYRLIPALRLDPDAPRDHEAPQAPGEE